MPNQQQINETDSTDEIDLGVLIKMIENGFKRIFRRFLEFFQYIKKNVFILGGLIVLGVVLGVGLNQVTSKYLKTEVIVKPNIESKNYLYGVVDEIQANIKAKDTSFFKDVGININYLKDFKIKVEPIIDKSKNTSIEEEMKYLELLQNFENTGVISDVVRAEILKTSSLNHRITFSYTNAEIGHKNSEKLIEYINSNDYYKKLIDTYSQNANDRIEKNQVLLEQIDGLIANYSNKMMQSDNQQSEGRIILDNEEKIDITGLFNLKNELIRDIEIKRLELIKRSEAISIINFGKSQVIEKSLFGKNIVFIPTCLVLLFFLTSILKYINKKAIALHSEN